MYPNTYHYMICLKTRDHVGNHIGSPDSTFVTVLPMNNKYIYSVTKLGALTVLDASSILDASTVLEVSTYQDAYTVLDASTV